jgi:hypothetical protein
MSSRLALAQRLRSRGRGDTPPRERIRFDSVAEVLIHVSPQDGFAQTTRAAVNEHDELVFADAKLLELVGLDNPLDRLQLGEVIATTDRAQRRIELRGFEIALSEEVADELIPRVFELNCSLAQRSSLASRRTRSVLNNAMPQPMSPPIKCG